MDNPSVQIQGLIPADPSPWEVVPPGEAQATQTIEAALAALVRAGAANGPARRDAHPKAHGCVRAEFRVLDDLPSSLQVGVFAGSRTYQAWIRFSNGFETPQDDKIGDARGMAIKLMGVEGSSSGTQDFLMINNPTLFVRDAIDYVAFQGATDHPLRFFFPSWNPFTFRLRELWVMRAIISQTVTNMLNIRYWSVTPYLYGDIPCKFSAKPAGPAFAFNETVGPNFLRDNLAKSLNAAEATFDFCVQLRTQPESMPVEDPRIEWREADSAFIPVARITIPKQSFETQEQTAFCENLSFTPWHGLDAHRPLGGINRVRRTVYETISRLRHDINATPREEPTARTPL
ncbi:catalase family protein [Methyloferula stellata]|uniref:catalase family protein n=1 Tax=Methyloferula stellata TaxID=876270 RepID=UPI000366665A|nr:catalase family protein [Methyloferula stellata]